MRSPDRRRLAGSTSADATAHVLGKGSKRRSVPVGGPALAGAAGWLALRAQMAKAG
jgi:integrase/recombinase XerC